MFLTHLISSPRCSTARDTTFFPDNVTHPLTCHQLRTVVWVLTDGNTESAASCGMGHLGPLSVFFPCVGWVSPSARSPLLVHIPYFFLLALSLFLLKVDAEGEGRKREGQLFVSFYLSTDVDIERAWVQDSSGLSLSSFFFCSPLCCCHCCPSLFPTRNCFHRKKVNMIQGSQCFLRLWLSSRVVSVLTPWTN